MNGISFFYGVVSGILIFGFTLAFNDYNLFGVGLSDAWISFFESIFVSAITIIGVFITLNRNQKINNESLEHNRNMIEYSIEKEQRINKRPWIRVQQFYSDVILSHIEEDGPHCVIETEQYKIIKQSYINQIDEINNSIHNMDFLDSATKVLGVWNYDIIENISSNPILDCEYNLKYKFDEEEPNSLNVNIGDIKGFEKVFVPLPYNKNKKLNFVELIIKGNSIYCEKLCLRIDYDNKKQIVEYIDEKLDYKKVYDSDFKEWSSIYITKKANDEFRKKYIDK